jgi:adenylate cyclase
MVTERRLAAILSADVVGYSRLMGEDEQATLESLKQSRAAITKLVNEQKGHILDTVAFP